MVHKIIPKAQNRWTWTITSIDNTGCFASVLWHCWQMTGTASGVQTSRASNPRGFFGRSMGKIGWSIIIIIIFFKGGLKIDENKLKGYDAQSVQSGTGRLSCSRTALKRCTSTETRWYRWLVSLVSPEIEEILLPRSFRSRTADALKTPKVSTAIGSNMWRPTMSAYFASLRVAAILLPPLPLPLGRLQWPICKWVLTNRRQVEEALTSTLLWNISWGVGCSTSLTNHSISVPALITIRIF